jgi:large subunit ribosomal protein L9
MKLFLLKDVEKIGLAGELITASDGFARNYLLPRKLAEEVTPEKEASYKSKVVVIENRKSVIASKTSMLAEKIAQLTLVLKKKMHDDSRLYGAVSATEIADLLKSQGVAVTKSQIIFDKKITAKGNFPITVKLSSSLQPKCIIKVVAE